MLDSGAVGVVAGLYAQRVLQSFPIKPDGIYIFGSYSNGNPTQDSDIDVAVVVNDFTGNKLEMSALLWELAADIDNRIEPILLDRTKDESGFVEYIIKTGLAFL